MKRSLSFFLFLGCAGAMLVTSPARAQMSRATLESLTVPGQDGFPDNRWQNVDAEWVSDFDYHHWSSATYGRALTPENTQSNNPDNVWYVVLSGPGNSQFQVMPYWDFPVPPGAYGTGGAFPRWQDGCNHAHFGYSAYSQFTVWNGVTATFYYYLRASEGRVGRRYDTVNGVFKPVTGENKPNLPCLVTSDPDVLYGGFLSPYIWRNNIESMTPVTFTQIRNGVSLISLDRVIVAMQGATHGFGDCGYFQCFPKVSLDTFRLK